MNTYEVTLRFEMTKKVLVDAVSYTEARKQTEAAINTELVKVTEVTLIQPGETDDHFDISNVIA